MWLKTKVGHSYKFYQNKYNNLKFLFSSLKENFKTSYKISKVIFIYLIQKIELMIFNEKMNIKKNKSYFWFNINSVKSLGKAFFSTHLLLFIQKTLY